MRYERHEVSITSKENVWYTPHINVYTLKEREKKKDVINVIC